MQNSRPGFASSADVGYSEPSKPRTSSDVKHLVSVRTLDRHLYIYFPENGLRRVPADPWTGPSFSCLPFVGKPNLAGLGQFLSLDKTPTDGGGIETST